MLQRLSAKKKNLLFIAVFFVSFAILHGVAFSPMLDQLKTLNNEILLKKRMIESSFNLLTQKMVIQEEVRRYAKYKQGGSQEEEASSFLEEIEEIARKSEIQLVRLEPLDTKKNDFYTGYTIAVKVESSMEQLMTFVYNLQNSESLLKVKRFRIISRAGTLHTDLTVSKTLLL